MIVRLISPLFVGERIYKASIVDHMLPCGEAVGVVVNRLIVGLLVEFALCVFYFYV